MISSHTGPYSWDPVKLTTDVCLDQMELRAKVGSVLRVEPGLPTLAFST
jgi:hypothetical protein